MLLRHSACPTLWDPTDCSPPGSRAPGIFQARILEWVAISFCRGSSQPKDRKRVSYVSYMGRQILYYQHHFVSIKVWWGTSRYLGNDNSNTHPPLSLFFPLFLITLNDHLILYSYIKTPPVDLCYNWSLGFPGGASGEEPACQCRRQKRQASECWLGKIPWRGAWRPTPVFLSGEFHGWESLVGHSP